MITINFFIDLIGRYGYIGVFLISFLSNGTYIFPVPYLIVIYSLGASHTLNPFLVAVISGLGATLGELILYFLSLLGRAVLPEKYKERAGLMKSVLGRYGAIVIFIFAATPLPDDIIYPLLGIMQYNFIKMFTSCFIGKALLSGVVVYSGFLSEYYLSRYLGGESTVPSIIAVILGIILTFIILKVDWPKYFNIGYIEGDDK